MSSNYPSNWNSIRKKVYKRDNYTCKNCGAEGGPHGQAELHAHHGVPLSKGGSNKLSNLQTYCKECHNAIHGDFQAPTANVNRRQKRQNTIDPTVTIVLELNISRNTPCPENVSRDDLAKSSAIVVGLITFSLFMVIVAILTTSMFQAIEFSVIASMFFALLAYAHTYRNTKHYPKYMGELNDIAKDYNDKKRQVNQSIEAERNVSDSDLTELKSLHSRVLQISSNINEGYIDEKFQHSISSTTADIKRIENGNLEWTT